VIEGVPPQVTAGHRERARRPVASWPGTAHIAAQAPGFAATAVSYGNADHYLAVTIAVEITARDVVVTARDQGKSHAVTLDGKERGRSRRIGCGQRRGARQSSREQQGRNSRA